MEQTVMRRKHGYKYKKQHVYNSKERRHKEQGTSKFRSDYTHGRIRPHLPSRMSLSTAAVIQKFKPGTSMYASSLPQIPICPQPNVPPFLLEVAFTYIDGNRSPHPPFNLLHLPSSTPLQSHIPPIHPTSRVSPSPHIHPQTRTADTQRSGTTTPSAFDMSA